MNDQPFKRHPHKMVKHTETIRRQFADDHFVGLALKGLIPAEIREATGIDKLACETIPYGSSKYSGKMYIPNMYNCLLPIKFSPTYSKFDIKTTF